MDEKELIVRQNSIQYAINTNQGRPMPAEELIIEAKKIEAYLSGK